MKNTVIEFTKWFDGLGLKHFNASELITYSRRWRNGVQNDLPPKEMWQRLASTLRIVDEMRSYFGRPCTILSAYRSPRYNAEVGGASRSQHLQNRALDIQVKGVSPKRVFRLLKKWREKGRFEGGLGLYTRSGFVHIDTRGYNATWGR